MTFFFPSCEFGSSSLTAVKSLLRYVRCIPPSLLFKALYLSNYRLDSVEVFKTYYSWPWEQNAQKIFLKKNFFKFFFRADFLVNYWFDLVHTWSNDCIRSVYSRYWWHSRNFLCIAAVLHIKNFWSDGN